MPGRIRPDDLNSDDFYTQRDYGRRHRSQPPKTNPMREEDRPQRPKFAKDDSYYDPRDRYYLSGDDEPDFHPYFATHRDDPPLREREESPPRHRHDSPPRYASPVRYESPSRRRQASRSRDRRRPVSPPRSHSAGDRARHQRHTDDDEYAPRSRHGGGAGAAGSSRHRSSTTAPAHRSDRDHDRDRGRSRRDTSRYPPSSSRSHRGPKRSSTQPASARRSSKSRSSSPSSPRSKKQRSQDMLSSAARAALSAGAMAAGKLHDDPGPWIGAKGTKVLSTALGAAIVDTFIEQRKPEMKGGVRHKLTKQAATFALANLVTKPAAKHGLGGHHVQKGMK